MNNNDPTSNRQTVSKPVFSTEAMERFFYWARDRVASAVASLSTPSLDDLNGIGNQKVLGAFVSFKSRGRLRSCMGHINEGTSMSIALDSAAVSAACRDPRFTPITPSEFYELDMEIWALGAMREIEAVGEARRDEIRVGVDGLQIVGRGRRGLLLPSVPIELGWSVNQYLEGLCDKAALSRDAWKAEDTSLFAFEGLSFKKPFVWHVSKNPELARLIKSIQESEEVQKSSNRPLYSLTSDFYKFQLPETRTFVPISDESSSVRPAAVSGMFYPSSRVEQDAMIDRILSEIRPEKTKKNVSAALVPHAGWIYSARLALETMSRIEPPETIVVLAPKHRREGANLAVMPLGRWDYGGGQIANNLDFVEAFVEGIPSFAKDEKSHQLEHSIEVQLPLIARLFPKARVVGVLIGHATQSELNEMAEKMGTMLEKWEAGGEKSPLLLISSDMNHYANEETTRTVDKIATDALETLSPHLLLSTVVEHRISMCGILPTYLTLATLKQRHSLSKATRVGYTTSAEVSNDKERVVGYAGYLFE